jgi:hypothetical protein
MINLFIYIFIDTSLAPKILYLEQVSHVYLLIYQFNWGRGKHREFRYIDTCINVGIHTCMHINISMQVYRYIHIDVDTDIGRHTKTQNADICIHIVTDRYRDRYT